MLTLGSVSREDAAQHFPFLATKFSGRRQAIKAFTHRAPDFVFWIYPDGRLFDAREAHRQNVPRGYEHILGDEPDYGGFLRGRVASHFEYQLIVVYCRPEALSAPGPQLTQFLQGIICVSVLLQEGALVMSDNGGLYGTLLDLEERAHGTISL